MRRQRKSVTVARVGLGASLALLAVGACDPCGGTVGCAVEPRISYTGHFVVRTTGASVAGVRVAFARRSGVALAADTLRAVSDNGGFFLIRGGASGVGSVQGELIVDPPAPWGSFTVPNVTLDVTDRKGDGGVLGRLVVDPFLQLLGELRDAKTNSHIQGATVTIRTGAPTILSPDSVVLVSDAVGRFYWAPTVLSYGPITARFAVRRANDTLVLNLERSIAPQHQDGDVLFVHLGAGRAIRYSATVARRGTNEVFDGATVEFVRTGGVTVLPDSVVVLVDRGGTMHLAFNPVDSGALTGRLTIRPPPPFPPETLPGVTLKVRDEDVTTSLGRLGYGAGATLQATFRQRASGALLAAGTGVRILPVGGQRILQRRADGTPDDLLRTLEENGRLNTVLATADTGQVIVDFEVRLPVPQKWDTVRAVAVPSRFSAAPTLLNFLVGPP